MPLSYDIFKIRRSVFSIERTFFSGFFHLDIIAKNAWGVSTMRTKFFARKKADCVLVREVTVRLLCAAPFRAPH
jgi:hypothetical protein